jgi:hypothetical protein
MGHAQVWLQPELPAGGVLHNLCWQYAILSWTTLHTDMTIAGTNTAASGDSTPLNVENSHDRPWYAS